MAQINIQEKRNLSELLAEGHRMFGKVNPRRVYREDDEGGGVGGADFLMSHPLFMDMPQGAASDLSCDVTTNSCSLDEADKRSNEASLALKRQLSHALGKSHAHIAKPTPVGR